MTFENKYKEELRKRLGLEPGDSSRDGYLANLNPLKRFKMLLGWHLGSEDYIYSITDWLSSQGLCISIDTDKIGVRDPLLKKVEIL